SSHDLLKSIPAYLKKHSHDFNAKDRNTELGLMRYISRIYAKTSPFSSFTHLAIARVVKDGNAMIQMEKNEEPRISSHIRLNNYLYAHLRNLLTTDRGIYLSFPVRTNPSIRFEAGQYVFLTNSSNIEAFQHLQANRVLEVILDLTKPEG